MTLTDEQITACATKLSLRACMHCGNGGVVISRRLYMLVTAVEPGATEMVTAPMVLVTCSRCGHTLFFSAAVLGLMTAGTVHVATA